MTHPRYQLGQAHYRTSPHMWVGTLINVEGVEAILVIIVYTVQCTVLINVEGVEAILVIIVYTVQCTVLINVEGVEAILVIIVYTVQCTVLINVEGVERDINCVMLFYRMFSSKRQEG